ncbi:glycosyltransferase family 4 protein [Effusibacillus lacus]|uniref:Glycosyl transferase n=1 Tax=Effusibacillus lacus TaxID=1348429 RepID=A0A292YPX3_9BACL|nr:glycosyltransferase family 4 protein [Effusibacillus lacus]TCS73506.1 glycosyltransferase involved in cell wall biosynthesis [Effusibacillus lacus]GAX91998.1 glycosyl transferase [Effusibacillus lacus]
MKLAFICTEKLPCPAIKGGAIQILIDGVSPILSKNYELTIFSIQDPSLPNREKRGRIEYIRLPSGKRYPEAVAKELGKGNYDVIHVFNRPKNVPIYAKAAPKSRFVLSLHNEMFAKEKISAKEAEEAIRSVRTIMTVSDYIGRTIVKRFPSAKNKVRTVYSGADLSTFIPVWSKEGIRIREKVRKKIGAEGKKIILFVGRLSANKGPHILIKSLKYLLNKHKDVVLVIVGGKWFSDNSIDGYVRSLHKLAKPFKKQVIFTKHVAPKEIPKYYLAADVFICSSQWQEPLARVHYEALAAGLPVITTKRGGNAEIVKHKQNGIVIKDYKNPKAFAEAIDSLLSNPQKAAKMAQKGRQFVKTNYQFKHVAHRLERVYLEAVGGILQ